MPLIIMGTTLFGRFRKCFAIVGLAATLGSMAADFNVTSPGFFFSFNGMQPNPTITLVRGKTYTFAVSTGSNHPFQILSPGFTTTNNLSSGVISYTVPTNAPTTVNPGYRCSVHHFSGTILTIDPPTPPVPRIVGYSLGTNLVLLSSPATNAFSYIPEFKTNLDAANWFALTVQTNRFVSGTNEAICGLPSGSNVFIRVRVQ